MDKVIYKMEKGLKISFVEKKEADILKKKGWKCERKGKGINDVTSIKINDARINL